jgi:hypothetical protein
MGGYRSAQPAESKIYKRLEEIDVALSSHYLLANPSLVSLDVIFISKLLQQDSIALSISEVVTDLSRYNFAMFQSLTSFNYTVAVVKNSFENDATWIIATAEKNHVNKPGWVTSTEGHGVLVNPPD